MESCKTKIIQKRIVIRSPFAMKDTIKALPGAIWNKGIRAWTLPATPAGAQSALTLNADHGDDVIGLATNAADANQIAAEKKLDAPPKTKTHPWDHQLIGYNLICKQQSTMLAWEMGVGKTKAVVDAVCNLSDCLTALVVCPKSVIDVWPEQFVIHGGVPVIVISLRKGTIKYRTKYAKMQIELQKYKKTKLVIVVNYEAVWREPMAGLVAAHKWGMIIADESHRIKSAKGKASRFLARLFATRKVALTGTPMPHSPIDVFGQYRFLDPGIFGTSLTRFRNRYAIMGGYGGYQVLGFQNQDELHRKFYSIGHRVRKHDVLDLPPVIQEQRTFDLSREAAKAYTDLEKQLIADVGKGMVTASNALARLMRLQQMTSGFAVIESGEHIEIDEGKLSLLCGYLEDLPKDEPVVVFCRFRHDLAMVHRACSYEPIRDCMELSGKRNELTGWKKAKGGEVLAVQIQAGGVGVDLTRAAYCVYYSIGFSLGDYLQSMARLDRPGQTRSVTYTHFIARGTVDEKIRKALAAKKNVVDSIIDNWKGT